MAKTIYDFLSHHEREPMPSWLAQYCVGDAFSAAKFFGSRTVFYPGSGSDGHAIKVFAGSGSAHCFVYVDYAMSRSRLVSDLDNPRTGFKGYRVMDQCELAQMDVVPTEWRPNLSASGLGSHVQRPSIFATEAYAWWVVLERMPDYDLNHGPERVAILFLGADGIAAYDALYCQKSSGRPPFAALIQDHGFGGNYDKFGQGGLLERLVITAQVFPSYVLFDTDSTHAWNSYDALNDLSPDRGGMHGNVRRLFIKPPLAR